MAKKYQDLSIFKLPDHFRGRSKITVQAWWIIQDTLFRCSPQALFGWRNALLRLFGAKIGNGVRIRPTARITYPWKLEIGENVWIGDDCVLYNLERISIGSNVALAHRVYLCTGSHDCAKPEFPIVMAQIKIENESWLANEVYVGPGVTVGYASVIGVRSMVLKDTTACMITYGSPASAVRPRVPAAVEEIASSVGV